MILVFLQSGFLDLAEFLIYLAFDKFLLFPPPPSTILLQSRMPTSVKPLASKKVDDMFFNIEVSNSAILLKLLMNC